MRLARGAGIRWALRALGVALSAVVPALCAAYVDTAVAAFAAACVRRGAAPLDGFGPGGLALFGLFAAPVLLTRARGLLGAQVIGLAAWSVVWWCRLPRAAALPDDCFELGNQVEIVEGHVEAPLFALVSLALGIYGMLAVDGAIRVMRRLRRSRTVPVRAPAGPGATRGRGRA